MRVGLTGPQLSHEALVDLQDVDREPGQVARRAVAGAEVIQRDVDTERFQLAEATLVILHQAGLGELDDQPVRIEPRGVSAARTVEVIEASWTWRGEMLTLTCSGRTPVAFHAWAWRQAWSRTHSPIGTMRPVSSATE